MAPHPPKRSGRPAQPVTALVNRQVLRSRAANERSEFERGARTRKPPDAISFPMSLSGLSPRRPLGGQCRFGQPRLNLRVEAESGGAGCMPDEKGGHPWERSGGRWAKQFEGKPGTPWRR